MRKLLDKSLAIGPSSIRTDELLLVREACRRLGWQRKTLAHAKAEGLRTIKFGRFCYVRGADLLEFFGRLAARQDGTGASA